jgi:ADP-ribosyl-[dinitrogen reductase] hydrolase
MRKTSLINPLQIAAVPAGPGYGCVGITFCPGKYDPHAMSGYWDRDLALDLDVIRHWGAAAVVTLMEAKELACLRVDRLGEGVISRGMRWFHLPIVDVSIPDAAFERKWDTAGRDLRTLLRDGRNVLVHCRGGLGRAGMIGTRLPVELGMQPETAIQEVRSRRRVGVGVPRGTPGAGKVDGFRDGAAQGARGEGRRPTNAQRPGKQGCFVPGRVAVQHAGDDVAGGNAGRWRDEISI